MVYETDLRLEDFIGLNWLMSKRTIYVFSSMLGLFFGGTLFVKIPDKIGFLCCLVIAISLLASVFGFWYIRKRSKMIYNRASVSESLKLILDERGIIQTSNSGETELLWEDVFSVRKNKTCYFVFLNQKQAFYFPKRNFAPGQERAFLELLSSKLPKEKIKC